MSDNDGDAGSDGDDAALEGDGGAWRGAAGGGALSEEQRLEQRRAWNRANAKKSRERKKFMLDTLLTSSSATGAQNSVLCSVIAAHGWGSEWTAFRARAMGTVGHAQVSPAAASSALSAESRAALARLSGVEAGASHKLLVVAPAQSAEAATAAAHSSSTVGGPRSRAARIHGRSASVEGAVSPDAAAASTGSLGSTAPHAATLLAPTADAVNGRVVEIVAGTAVTLLPAALAYTHPGAVARTMPLFAPTAAATVSTVASGGSSVVTPTPSHSPALGPASPAPSIMEQTLTDDDYAFIEFVTRCKQHFIITDPLATDNPIVFASQGFYDLTGYAPQEILGFNCRCVPCEGSGGGMPCGVWTRVTRAAVAQPATKQPRSAHPYCPTFPRRCRFLQGRDTDLRTVDAMRQGVAAGEDVHVVVLNYRKDGTPFWNELFMSPLRNAAGDVVHFVGVQSDVPDYIAHKWLAKTYPGETFPATAAVPRIRPVGPGHRPEIAGLTALGSGAGVPSHA